MGDAKKQRLLPILTARIHRLEDVFQQVVAHPWATLDVQQLFPGKYEGGLVGGLGYAGLCPAPNRGLRPRTPIRFFTNGIKGSVTLCGSGRSPATAQQGFRIFKDTEYNIDFRVKLGQEEGQCPPPWPGSRLF